MPKDLFMRTKICSKSSMYVNIYTDCIPDFRISGFGNLSGSGPR